MTSYQLWIRRYRGRVQEDWIDIIGWTEQSRLQELGKLIYSFILQELTERQSKKPTERMWKGQWTQWEFCDPGDKGWYGREFYSEDLRFRNAEITKIVPLWWKFLSFIWPCPPIHQPSYPLLFSLSPCKVLLSQLRGCVSEFGCYYDVE